MFLEEAAIRYVFRDFKLGQRPNKEDLRSLAESWDDDYAEAPFCNSGDFDLDDLSDECPESWCVTKTGNLGEGESRIAIVAINYDGERQLDLELENINIAAFNICGLFALNAGDSHEEVFGEEWESREEFEEKIVLFMHKYKGVVCDEEILESSLDSMQEDLGEWLECIDNPPSQEAIDEKLANLKKMFG